MPFILNVGAGFFKTGEHKNPGDNSIAIQILSKGGDFGPTEEPTPFPVSPHKFKEHHYFRIEDTEDETGITEEEALKIVDILKDALKNGSNVIVHCAAGVCRSGAVAEIGIIMGFDDTKAFRSPNLRMKRMMMQILMKNMFSE